jgi:hypothetical protein
MRIWPKTPRARKITVALLFLILLAFLWVIYTEIFDRPSALSLAEFWFLMTLMRIFEQFGPKIVSTRFRMEKGSEKLSI